MRESNDLVTKNFEAYPDVAADIVNALIHGGEKKSGQGSYLPHRQRASISTWMEACMIS